MKHLLFCLATLSAFLVAGCDFEERVPAEMTSMDQARPLENEKSLNAEIRFDIGSVDITADRKPNAYSIDLEYDKSSFQPELRYDPGDEGRLYFRLESTHKSGVRTERQPNRLRVNLNQSVPVRLTVNTGVGDARLNLSGLKISALQVESGVGASKISAYEPNTVACSNIRIKNGVGSMDAVGLGNLNFRDFEFEGGIGGATLDFTGDWKEGADVRIQVGVGGVTMRMPRELGVRVEAEKHLLSGLHLDGFAKRDASYYSENYDKSKIRISVRVATGIGGFRIVWV
jgi:hypothetical protein